MSAAVFWLAFFPIGFALAALVYLLSRKLDLYALVDTIWTLGLGLAVLVYAWWLGVDSWRTVVVLTLVLVWSGRLTLHLLRDRILPGREDPRYAALAAHWGASAERKFILVFLAQVPLVALFLFPVSLALAADTGGWRWLDTLGLAIAVIALAGESLADRQLARFRADPANRGKVCRNGLWRYSRHPNYFFEWVHWLSYVAFAYGAPFGHAAWVGPVMMYLFLRYITGVPFAERSSLKSRGDAYRDYQETTNVFFPWKPRSKPTS